MTTLIKRILFFVLMGLLLPNPVYAKVFSYMDNGVIKIGVITDWGAGMGYFSQVSPEFNFLNSYDTGREMQQSYYGNPGAGHFLGTLWPWNPVQSGDAAGNPSTVVEFENTGSSIYAKVIPKDWQPFDTIPPGGVDIDGYMEEWVTFHSENVVKIHFKFTYTGEDTHTYRAQEQPAIFHNPLAAFSYDEEEGWNAGDNRIVYYGGGAPWTNDTLTFFQPTILEGPASGYAFEVTEEWRAVVNAGTNWGMGAYTPGAFNTTSYAFVGGGAADTVYYAPVIYHSFTPDSTYEYDVYMTIGSISDIRSRFYNIKTEISSPDGSITPTGLAITATLGSPSIAWNRSDAISPSGMYMTASLGIATIAGTSGASDITLRDGSGNAATLYDVNGNPVSLRQ